MSEEERRKQEHERSVLKTMGDVWFLRARNIEVELHPGEGGMREHLILLPQPSGASVALDLTERVNRLDQLEKTDEGRTVIREALMRLELEGRIKEGDW
jgi:hypothetical protein